MLIRLNPNDSTQTLNSNIRISTGCVSRNIWIIVLDSYSYIEPFHDFKYKNSPIKNKFFHYEKWWDWFRTGAFQQPCKKKKVIKSKTKYNKKYWRRILYSKSGWVGKAIQRRKGK